VTGPETLIPTVLRVGWISPLDPTSGEAVHILIVAADYHGGTSQLWVSPAAALPLWQDVRSSLNNHDLLPTKVDLEPSGTNQFVLVASSGNEWRQQYAREMVPKLQELAEVARQQIPLRVAEGRLEDAQTCERVAEMATGEVAKLSDPQFPLPANISAEWATITDPTSGADQVVLLLRSDAAEPLVVPEGSVPALLACAIDECPGEAGT
jgi:hypothetical protein